MLEVAASDKAADMLTALPFSTRGNAVDVWWKVRFTNRALQR